MDPKDMIKGHLYYFRVKNTEFIARFTDLSSRNPDYFTNFDLIAATPLRLVPFSYWCDNLLWHLSTITDVKEIRLEDLPLYITWEQKAQLFDELLRKGGSHEQH